MRKNATILQRYFQIYSLEILPCWPRCQGFSNHHVLFSETWEKCPTLCRRHFEMYFLQFRYDILTLIALMSVLKDIIGNMYFRLFVTKSLNDLGIRNQRGRYTGFVQWTTHPSYGSSQHVNRFLWLIWRLGIRRLHLHLPDLHMAYVFTTHMKMGHL